MMLRDLTTFLLVTVVLLSFCCISINGVSTKDVLAFGLGRRKALQTASTVLVGGLSFLGNAKPAFAQGESSAGAGTPTQESTPSMMPSFAAYSITPDSSAALNPTLKSLDVRYTRSITVLCWRPFFLTHSHSLL